jgi:transposase-like protein
VRVLDHAERTGNVAETCRVFGVSRKTFSEWRNRAARYGLDALMPQGAPGAADAHHYPDLGGQRAGDLGGDRADHRLPPVRRPAR